MLNGDSWVKNDKVVDCLSKLTLPLKVDDEVVIKKSYHLSASICHSGTRVAGHYTAHVLHKQHNKWLLCNDKAVIPVPSSKVNGKYCYVLFYEVS